jgi:Tol biopolymer transport system component
MYFRPQPGEEFRFQIPLSGTAQPYDRCCGATVTSSRMVAGTNFAISPNGRLLAFVTRADNNEPWALYVRAIGSVAPQKLVGIDDAGPHASQPFWSADSRFIGFVTSGKLEKIEASGGPSQFICDAAGFSGGTWNREGTILFGTPLGIFKVSAEGGKPEAVTTMGQGESGHFWPRFLPDGQHYLYTTWNTESAKRAIVSGKLGSKEATRLVAAESNAGYAEPGYILFRRENAVYAQPFSAKNLTVSGEPARVADEVSFVASNGLTDFSVSPGGVLVFFQTGAGGTPAAQDDPREWQLAWTDRMGKLLGTIGPPGIYRGLELSPDGKRIAVHRHDASGGDLIVIEMDSSTKRLTFDATHHNSSPIWAPTGDRIAYGAIEKGKWGIYQTLSSGSGTEELLYESEFPKAPMSWSPDGKRIVFWQQDPKSGGDLWVLNVEDKKAEALIATPANETHGQISPDGKWIAYTSNSVGGRPEIFVQPFPTGTGRYQISFHGGDWPRWRGDGKELVYHSIAINPDQPAITGVFRGGSLSSSDVTASGSAFDPKTPREFVRIVAMNFVHSGGDYQTYAIKPDAKQILMLQLVNSTNNNIAATGDAVGPDPPLSITVAMNWASSLKK